MINMNHDLEQIYQESEEFEDNEYVSELMGSLEIPKEFEDWRQVLMEAKKYGPNDWLYNRTPRSSFKGFHDCMFHHLARSFAGTRTDAESGFDHLLHLITNAQMLYVLLKRGIVENETQ